MRISEPLNQAFNDQIGRELGSSHQYINMAAYFDDLALSLLARMFYKQAAEEREHAMKFVHYLTHVNGHVEVPAVAATTHEFKSVEAAVQLAYDYEVDVTKRIDALMDLAVKDNDHAAQDFLRWFVTEQVEEVHTMENMLRVVKAAGDRNLMMIEAYLVHIEKGQET